MKKILGVIMIVFGVLLLLGTISSAIKNLFIGQNVLSDNSVLYNGTYITGVIVSTMILGWLCFLLIKYGIRFMKELPAKPETLDSDSWGKS